MKILMVSTIEKILKIFFKNNMETQKQNMKKGQLKKFLKSFS